MPHDHHEHRQDANRTRLGIALGLTSSVLLIEVIGSVLTGSLSLLVDAAHMLTDTAGLAIALIAAALVRRVPSSRYTWGLRRAEALAAAAQAIILLAVGVYALCEGFMRLLVEPAAVSDPRLLLALGTAGLVANLFALAILSGGRTANLNMRAAFLEVANDALGSIAVIVGALVILTTGWTGADAIAGMVIAGLILPRAFLLLRRTTAILMESSPQGLDLNEVRAHMLAMPHVTGVHDLHASQIATGLPVLTAHVVVDDPYIRPVHTHQVLRQLQRCAATHFAVAVEHCTFQIEPGGYVTHEKQAHA